MSTATTVASKSNVPASAPLLEIEGVSLPENIQELIVCHLNFGPQENFIEKEETNVLSLCGQPGRATHQHQKNIAALRQQFSPSLVIHNDTYDGDISVERFRRYLTNEHAMRLATTPLSLTIAKMAYSDGELTQLFARHKDQWSQVQRLCISDSENMRNLQVKDLPNLRFLQIHGQYLSSVVVIHCPRVKVIDFSGDVWSQPRLLTIDVRGLNCTVMVQNHPGTATILATNNQGAQVQKQGNGQLLFFDTRSPQNRS